MPLRKVPLINNQVYHVYGRSVAQQPIFRNIREYNIFLGLIEYYKFKDPPRRFSHFVRLCKDEKDQLLNSLYRHGKSNIEIYAFCFMPNHYHLLLKQTLDNGISNSIRLIQNSYARYLNIKSKRFGSLFQSPFKAKRIEADDQFIHVARYIHLNPLTTFLLKDLNSLNTYEWSSYIGYIGNKPYRFLSTSFLMSFFKDKERFKNFTKDNLDYQRRLDEIKHLTFE